MGDDRMAFRVLIATGNPDFRQTLRELTDTTCSLLPIGIEIEETSSLAHARERLAIWNPDALLLDWHLIPTDVPETLRGMLAEHPDLRVLVLLPGSGREYRLAAWSAGACACVPRDRIDPEWLQAMLCVMNRAKEREVRIRGRVA
jgi:DNA-binding NarL/FixJ family response regulator